MPKNARSEEAPDRPQHRLNSPVTGSTIMVLAIHVVWPAIQDGSHRMKQKNEPPVSSEVWRGENSGEKNLALPRPLTH
jgi:hypothetical protein